MLQQPFDFAADSRSRPDPTPFAWLLFAPLVLWALSFVAAPALLMLAYSFCRRGTLGGVVWEFTLANWKAVADPVYLKILGRSVACASVTTACCLAIAYPVAWHIGRAPEAARRRLLLIVMIPFWTSFLVRTMAWVAILRTEGLLNGILLWAGIVEAPLQMLYTPGAVLVGLVYTFLPFMILPIHGSVEKLDRSLVEAALDLGATRFRAFTRVVLPMTWPGVAAGTLLVFVPALGLYAVNDLLGGGKVDMIGNVIENQFRGSARNWPFGAALGTTLLAAFAVAWRLADGPTRPRSTTCPRAGTG